MAMGLIRMLVGVTIALVVWIRVEERALLLALGENTPPTHADGTTCPWSVLTANLPRRRMHAGILQTRLTIYKGRPNTMLIKRTARLRRVVIVAGCTLAALVGLGSSASAMRFAGRPLYGFNPHRGWAPFWGRSSDVTLNGLWAPFNRCPVDNPTMLSADGVAKIALCVTVNSPSSFLTIGHITAPLGESNVQVGLVINNETSEETAIAPRDGTVDGAPVQLPGGLQALVCPNSARYLREICGPRPNRWLNTVTSTIMSAGEPSNFNLLGGLFGGAVPLVSLPIKLHLENPLLGWNCYIGSNSEPVVLRPQIVTSPTGSFEMFDANGTPDPNGVMTELSATGGSMGDNQLAIPGASGCGFWGQFDSSVDRNIGLPSPSGNNAVLLNEASLDLTGIAGPESVAPNDGKDLSSNWHSAVLHGDDHH
jgi:hypothetical protein